MGVVPGRYMNLERGIAVKRAVASIAFDHSREAEGSW